MQEHNDNSVNCASRYDDIDIDQLQLDNEHCNPLSTTCNKSVITSARSSKDCCDISNDHEITSTDLDIGEDLEAETDGPHGLNYNSVDHDIVLKAFQLMEDMKGSHKNLLEIVNYGKELYCKGNSELLSRWPTSWNACMGLLRKAGYKEPITYYVCLNTGHQCFWSITDSATDTCKYCNKKGEIEFYYLTLADKIR